MFRASNFDLWKHVIFLYNMFTFLQVTGKQRVVGTTFRFVQEFCSIQETGAKGFEENKHPR